MRFLTESQTDLMASLLGQREFLGQQRDKDEWRSHYIEVRAVDITTGICFSLICIPRSWCQQDWLKHNPNGTDTDFETYWKAGKDSGPQFKKVS